MQCEARSHILEQQAWIDQRRLMRKEMGRAAEPSQPDTIHVSLHQFDKHLASVGEREAHSHDEMDGFFGPAPRIPCHNKLQGRTRLIAKTVMEPHRVRFDAIGFAKQKRPGLVTCEYHSQAGLKHHDRTM